jgi:type I restriction enzyme M protein
MAQLPLTLPLEQSVLETQLFEAANILRGPVDAADFKTYIFPLLFFKRISDVYDEEYNRALDDSGGDLDYASFNEHHRFQIPEECRWKNIQETSTNVGQALQNALQCIEKANPHTLSGIFGDAQWTNKERLSDELLRDLINHFSGIPLSNATVSGDILGQAYEYLIKKFADATNKKAGEFYTPRSIVRLMINILDPQEGESVYDPACGTGGMLLEAIQHIRENGGNPRTLLGKLYGQEKNLTTSSIARMNLLLHDFEDFHIERGDTLRQPAFFTDDQLATFDCVIANPPFSLERWGDNLWESDRYGRNIAGIPPKTNGDFAWVQHMLVSMKPRTGRMAVVLPHGVLFRMGAEGAIRQKLVERDLIEAIIGLGPNLFYGTGLAACILVFRSQKTIAHKQQVLVIDASRLYKRGRNQNTLEQSHAAQIFNWYKNYCDVPGTVRVVPLSEIADNNWNLNISRYIDPIIETQTLSVEQALTNLQVALDDAYNAEDRLRKLLRESGLL